MNKLLVALTCAALATGAFAVTDSSNDKKPAASAPAAGAKDVKKPEAKPASPPASAVKK
jgi:hypothetical protein